MKKILFFTILILFVSTQIVSAEDNAPKLPTFSEITVGGVNIKVAWLTQDAFFTKEFHDLLSTYEPWIITDFGSRSCDVMDLELNQIMSCSADNVNYGLGLAVDEGYPVLWVEMINDKEERAIFMNPISLVGLPDRVSYGKDIFQVIPDGLSPYEILPFAKDIRFFVFNKREGKPFQGGILLFDINMQKGKLELKLEPSNILKIE